MRRVVAAISLASVALLAGAQEAAPGASAQNNAAAGEITPELLLEHGLVRRGRRVKILGDGELEAALTVKAHRFSRAAREKIEAAGGSCEELGS